jgi:hypothetical protein
LLKLSAAYLNAALRPRLRAHLPIIRATDHLMSLSNEQGAPTETRYDKPLDSGAVENEIQIGTAKKVQAALSFEKMSLASRGMASTHIRKLVMAGPETWILSAAEKFWAVGHPDLAIDLLRAFVAVVETGKLQGSGDVVGRLYSAVS